MECIWPRRLLTLTQTVDKIEAALLLAYPNETFQVSSEHGTPHDVVVISWIDGPIPRKVMDLASAWGSVRVNAVGKIVMVDGPVTITAFGAEMIATNTVIMTNREVGSHAKAFDFVKPDLSINRPDNWVNKAPRNV